MKFMFSLFICIVSFTQVLSATCPHPPSLPYGISVQNSSFSNWDGELQVSSLWITSPKNPQDLVALANWAWKNGYQIRPKGISHSWAPFSVTKEADCRKTLLVDLTGHLNKISDPDETKGTISVETGAVWDDLLSVLETKGYGIFAYPETGKVTLGGTLAVGAHGTGISINGQSKDGSVSNLVEDFEAVVWDSGAYTLKTFERKDEDAKGFLVHLGRALLTRVTLSVMPIFNIRCRSLTNISADVVYGSESSNEFSMATLVSKFGRVDAQLYPYTKRTMIRIWNVEENKPKSSKEITQPYPFTHSDIFSTQKDMVMKQISLEIPTPGLQEMKYKRDVATLYTTKTGDVWGASKNSLLYYSSDSQKWGSIGHMVLTTKDKVQSVISTLYKGFSRLISKAKNFGEYPMNQPVQVRVTGLDNDPGAPSLSFLSPVEGHPEYDVAVFFGLHYYVGTPKIFKFLKDWETFLFTNYKFSGKIGSIGTVRMEWAKTWGSNGEEAWSNATIYSDLVPPTFGENWEWSLLTLDKYDPHRIFSNAFLDKLMPKKK